MIDSNSWLTIAPELLLLVAACVIALVDLGVKTKLRTLTYVLTLATLAAIAVLTANHAMAGATTSAPRSSPNAHRSRPRIPTAPES